MRGLYQLGVITLLSTQASSAAIISGVTARASSEFAGRPAASAVNGQGLGAGDTHTGGGASTADMWLGANGDTSPTFEIDLGAVYNLNSVQVWNYNEAANATCCLDRGVQTGTLDAGTAYNSYSPVGPVAFNKAPGTETNFSETFPLGGLTTRYLRLNVGANYGDASFTGLSEVRFDGVLAAGQATPLSIVGATASTEFGGREAINAANRSGLFGPTHSINPTGTMWLGTQFDLTGDITFDLGSSQAIGDMTLWNYNESLPGREAELLSRGVDEVEIFISDDNVAFTSLGIHNFGLAPGTNLDPFGQTVGLNSTGQYVKLDILSNHGNADFTGISEVQFLAPIPEPSTSALIGVFLMALLSRRRR